MLFLSGCGGGGTSGGSTPVQPAPEPGETLPITEQGNYLLLPGYTYPVENGDVLQMHVLQAGNVLFAGSACGFNVFDSNYNEYDIADSPHNDEAIFIGEKGYFESGWYYLNVRDCPGKEVSVQSNVL